MKAATRPVALRTTFLGFRSIHSRLQLLLWDSLIFFCLDLLLHCGSQRILVTFKQFLLFFSVTVFIQFLTDDGILTFIVSHVIRIVSW